MLCAWAQNFTEHLSFAFNQTVYPHESIECLVIYKVKNICKK